MAGRYLVTGVQLGMLIGMNDPEQRKELGEKIEEEQYAGYSENDIKKDCKKIYPFIANLKWKDNRMRKSELFKIIDDAIASRVFPILLAKDVEFICSEEPIKIGKGLDLLTDLIWNRIENKEAEWKKFVNVDVVEK